MLGLTRGILARSATYQYKNSQRFNLASVSVHAKTLRVGSRLKSNMQKKKHTQEWFLLNFSTFHRVLVKTRQILGRSMLEQSLKRSELMNLSETEPACIGKVNSWRLSDMQKLKNEKKVFLLISWLKVHLHRLTRGTKSRSGEFCCRSNWFVTNTVFQNKRWCFGGLGVTRTAEKKKDEEFEAEGRRFTVKRRIFQKNSLQPP